MIDKNIPFGSGAYQKRSIKLSQMEVGDSIFDKDAACVSTASSKWYSAAQQFGLKHGVKFSGRKVDGGIRIWRVS